MGTYWNMHRATKYDYTYSVYHVNIHYHYIYFYKLYFYFSTQRNYQKNTANQPSKKMRQKEKKEKAIKNFDIYNFFNKICEQNCLKCMRV